MNSTESAHGGPEGTGSGTGAPQGADAPESDTVGQEAVRVWRGMRTLVLETADVRPRVVEALGMSYFRAKALRYVADQGPLTLSALAAALFADAPYTTLSIDYLVRRGLVTREPNPADRRSKLVEVTEAGAEAAAEMARITDNPPPALRGLAAADLAALARILDRALHTGPADGRSGS
ncbi:MarR family transcriptional regulator [Streptomyces sp. NPDC006784]|uniref:MarR family transcriptional regulator n=1 Tax=Streptomyces sp. NPDC006784 TaxID=3364764 RepID=UPI0036CA310B